VLASFSGVETGLVVQPVRQRADHDTDIVSLEYGVIVSDELDVGISVFPGGCGFGSLLGDDLEFGAGGLVHDIDVTSADSARAQYCYSNQFVQVLVRG
jgi:hypothetical protein